LELLLKDHFRALYGSTRSVPKTQDEKAIILVLSLGLAAFDLRRIDDAQRDYAMKMIRAFLSTKNAGRFLLWG